MNLCLSRSVRTALATLALGGAVLALPAAQAVDAQSAAPASAPHATDTTRARMADRMEHHLDEALHERLAHLADRLEIRASQQPQWQKFSAAFTDAAHAHFPEAGHGPADGPLDAAGIARAHADHAARIAQAAARVADATAELQAVLGVDQRKVLDEVSRQFAHHGFGHGGEGMHGAGMHGPMSHGGEHCDGPEGGEGPHHGDWPHGAMPGGPVQP
jgi:cell pole-organizing protein PopZ